MPKGGEGEGLVARRKKAWWRGGRGPRPGGRRPSGQEEKGLVAGRKRAWWREGRRP